MPELKRISNGGHTATNSYYALANEVTFTYDNEKKKYELGAKQAEESKNTMNSYVENQHTMQKKRSVDKKIGNDIQRRINNDEFVTYGELAQRDASYNAMDISDIETEIATQKEIQNKRQMNGNIEKYVESATRKVYDKAYINQLVKVGSDIQEAKDYTAKHGVDVGFGIRR